MNSTDVGAGYALVPQSVQALDRAGVIYLPLSDEGVVSPIVMNRRRNDDSDLTTFLRGVVRSLPRSASVSAKPGLAPK